MLGQILLQIDILAKQAWHDKGTLIHAVSSLTARNRTLDTAVLYLDLGSGDRHDLLNTINMTVKLACIFEMPCQNSDDPLMRH